MNGFRTAQISREANRASWRLRTAGSFPLRLGACRRGADQPEPDLWVLSMKSYGRAPIFPALTGYEQVRSVVAALAGDHEAATRASWSYLTAVRRRLLLRGRVPRAGVERPPVPS